MVQKKLKHSVFLMALLLGFGTLAMGQSKLIPFDSESWNMENGQAVEEEYMGKKSILLKQGIMYVDDVNFTDGIIEVDVNFSEVRGFPGVAFHLADAMNYEEFYIRSHQSGNPDACQYTPVFNGLAGWQLYHGDGYSTAIKHKFDEWNHLKIWVKGGQAKFYLNDMEKPFLTAPELKRGTTGGKIGLKTNMSPVHFANFRYEAFEAEPASGKETKAKNDGVIRKWQLSETFAGKELEGKVTLPSDLMTKKKWKEVEGESDGLINFAKFATFSRQSNTVFSKVTLQADKQEPKRIDFGYSDLVKVYLNGVLIYSGDNTYRSRDYRYLGTIGYFDQLYLPLEKGGNELIFAVTERFGGWGLKVKAE